VIPLDPLTIALAGTSLIEASAGTGKTYTIATLYLRLLLERGLRVDEILVVTYTRAATAELRERIRSRIAAALSDLEAEEREGDPVLSSLSTDGEQQDDREVAARRLASALADFDEAAILTIHGFCQRVLTENAFESRASFELELLVDQDALVLEIVGDYWAQSIAGESETFIRYLARKKVAVDSLLKLARRASTAEAIELVPPIDAALRDQFDQLESDWSRALEETRRLWSKDASEVIALLHRAAADGVLKKNIYKPDAIAVRFETEMDQLLAEYSPGLGMDSKVFENFTPAKLERGTRTGKDTPEHPFFNACGDLWAADEAFCQLLDAQRIEFERGLINAVERESRIRKQSLGQQSYDDLLREVAGALARDGGHLLASRLRNQYRAALVDEFQDTDRLQYRIIRSVWHLDPSAGRVNTETDTEAPTLFLIGDPKQAIYSFRGADVYAYIMAKADAGDRCFTLATNWRSDPSMIRAVNTLFGRSSQPFRVEGIPFEPVVPRPDAKDEIEENEIDGSDLAAAKSPALEILFAPRTGTQRSSDSASLSRRVATQIAELVRGSTTIRGSSVRPSDIAVLCRTNDQTDVMCRELRAVGIPAALLGSASVFETEEAREIGYVLAAIASPGSGGRVRAALATRIFGLNSGALSELQSSAQSDPNPNLERGTGDKQNRHEEDWDAWLLRFRRWQNIWQARGFIQMFHQLFREARVHPRLLALADGERRLTNFLHLAELIERAIAKGQLGQRASLEWLAQVLRDRSFRENAVGDQGELRLESDADAVKVVTLHKSKGLEYPIVYCPFLWAGADLRADEKRWTRFHDPSRDGQIVLDLGSAEKQKHQDLALAETVAESVRLLYVALTRAKHRCSVVWGNFKGAGNSPLAPLLHSAVCNDSAPPGALGKRDDAEMLAEIELLAEASAGSIGVRELGLQSASGDAPTQDPRELLPTPVSREISLTWRHSSFSALSASDPRDVHGMPQTREEGLDYDAVTEVPALELQSEVEAEVLLSSFPAGATAGTMLHSILEHLDFENASSEQSRDIVGKALELHGIEAGWEGQLCHALDRIIKTRWSEDGPALADLPLSRRLDELEFLLPVASREIDGSRRQGLSVADLSEVFMQHAKSDFQKIYAERLRDLRFDDLAGYLKGFIDLVFEWNGRFYLVDYKSNHLGASPANYDLAGLEVPMSEHHYVLQYHLYTVALDRYLGMRLEGYDYDRDFGGVYYLFLRGMDPDLSVGSGIFYDRPTREFASALSNLLTEPSGALT
jgi:exodeoxyribonuclease V beta subunit